MERARMTGLIWAGLSLLLANCGTPAQEEYPDGIVGASRLGLTARSCPVTPVIDNLLWRVNRISPAGASRDGGPGRGESAELRISRADLHAHCQDLGGKLATLHLPPGHYESVVIARDVDGEVINDLHASLGFFRVTPNGETRVPVTIRSAQGTVVANGNWDIDNDSFGQPDAGAAPPRDPLAMSISPILTDFGPVVVGATSGPRTIKVVTAGGDPTRMPLHRLSGSGSGDFRVTPRDCQVMDQVRTCTFEVQFTPSGTGRKEASLTVEVGQVSGTVSLTGEATAAPGAMAPRLMPSSADFGRVPVGMSSAPQIFTVSNAGATTVGPVVVGTTGDFSLGANGCTLALPPAESCTVEVRFQPMSSGPSSGTLRVELPDGARSEAPLSGVGGAEEAPAPEDDSFGQVGIGSVSEGAESVTVGAAAFGRWLAAGADTVACRPVRTASQCTTYECTGSQPRQPTHESAGDITVTGGHFPMTFVPDMAGRYANVQEGRALWDGGQTIRVAGAGAAFPAFTATLRAPYPLRLGGLLAPAGASERVPISRSRDLTFDWTPQVEGALLVLIQSPLAQVWYGLRCRISLAEGRVTIPAAALEPLPTGEVYLQLSHGNQTEVMAGGRKVSVGLNGATQDARGDYFPGVFTGFLE